jgi:hypothetical protein
MFRPCPIHPLEEDRKCAFATKDSDNMTVCGLAKPPPKFKKNHDILYSGMWNRVAMMSGCPNKHFKELIESRQWAIDRGYYSGSTQH